MIISSFTEVALVYTRMRPSAVTRSVKDKIDDAILLAGLDASSIAKTTFQDC